MLTHPTKEKLNRLKLYGMARAMEEQKDSREYNDLSFEERLGLLVDRETIERENRQLQTRLRQAKLPVNVCMADIDYRESRSMDKSMMKSFEPCQWVKESLNILITGPCGVGKTYIGQALAHQGCLKGPRALYLRLPRLFVDLSVARGDGRLDKLMRSLARTRVLVLDDFGLDILSEEHRRFLLEILEDRYENGSTIITSQLPVEHWHEMIGNATLADAILDRLVHNAYTVALDGPSMRRLRAKRAKRKSKLT